MGRTKQTVEYFPHYCLEAGGSLLKRQLRHRLGIKGTGAYFELLEVLGKNEGHFIDLSKTINILDLQTVLMLTEAEFNLFTGVLVDVEAIDRELWENERILWLQGFVDSLSELYRKRTEIPTKPALRTPKTNLSILTGAEYPPTGADEKKTLKKPQQTAKSTTIPATTPTLQKEPTTAITPLSGADTPPTGAECMATGAERRGKGVNFQQRKGKESKGKEKINSRLFSKAKFANFPDKNIYCESFTAIWKKYPSNAGKKIASKHWNKTILKTEDVDRINLALDNYLADLAKPENNWKREQNGSTWFNNWLDWESESLVKDERVNFYDSTFGLPPLVGMMYKHPLTQETIQIIEVTGSTFKLETGDVLVANS